MGLDHFGSGPGQPITNPPPYSSGFAMVTNGDLIDGLGAAALFGVGFGVVGAAVGPSLPGDS
jgi:hypothetical protein